MAGAFQSTAFQNSAFQTDASTPVVATVTQPDTRGSGWRFHALAELPWRKRKPRGHEEQLDDVIHVVEQVVEAAPYEAERIAETLLEHDSYTKLRHIDTRAMLEKIELALTELDDEEVLLLLH